MSHTVRLTAAEVGQAAYSGMRSRVRAIERGRRPAHGFEGPGWNEQIEGRCAELAFAKLTGRYLADDDALDHDGDVGAGIQIRSTRYRPALLRINRSDQPGHAFILAVGQTDQWEFPGWIRGREAMTPAHWRDTINGTKLREGAYYVAAGELQPIPDGRIARSGGKG